MTFRFLNETHVLKRPGDWDDPGLDKLWRYNLHYFDDLNSEKAHERTPAHEELMVRWAADNPPGVGTGWEPYPTSLRVVNWVKWALGGREFPLGCVQSLAVQARWLSAKPEYHLLGNHLFANAKALVFAGLFFEGSEASRWLEKGFNILAQEIPEQILPDGGQFERSTMYHALALEDMLDLSNVAAAYAGSVPERWASRIADWLKIIGPMRRWLQGMCHPDGQISFFNDAALGIAPSPAEIEAYAERLGFAPVLPPGDGVTDFSDSGYIRVQCGPMTALLDVAPVGPDYLPAHAHADTLSFELSLHGQRVIVNSGTSCYGDSQERLRQRGTAAHNTVAVNGRDSSEVWGGFRVARRAKPGNLSINRIGREIRIEARHDGYSRLPGRNTHRRCWTAQETSLQITDEISGPFDKAEAYFHLHPSIKPGNHVIDENRIVLRLPDERQVVLRSEGGALTLTESTWHPAFGCSEPTMCLVVRLRNSSEKTVFDWSKSV